MDRFGFNWEPHQTKTEDGQTLTTFRVTGNNITGEFVPSKPPVLLMIGAGGDAYHWLWHVEEGTPMPLDLARRGYDVWMVNPRGTMYSEENDRYTVDDYEYWDWSWSDQGVIDNVALVSMVKQVSGVNKIIYVGFS